MYFLSLYHHHIVGVTHLRRTGLSHETMVCPVSISVFIRMPSDYEHSIGYPKCLLPMLTDYDNCIDYSQL